MKAIKLIRVLIILLLVIALSCKKESNKENESANFVLSEIIFDSGSLERFYYNDTGKLRKISKTSGDILEFHYIESNKLVKVTGNDNYSEDYFYENERLKYIVFVAENYLGRPDTLFFIYDNTNEISEYITSYIYSNSLHRSHSKLTYDTNKRLITKVNIKNESNLENDSTYFKWSNEGNLIEINYNSGTSKFEYKINYEYDTFLNYYNTINYPYEYLLWNRLLVNMTFALSKNNLSEYNYTDNFGNSQSEFYQVMKSESNIPTRIESTNDSWDLVFLKK